MTVPYRELNRELILKKASDIRVNVAFIRQQAELPDKVFLSDEILIRAVRYAFITVTEAAANICAHITARLLSQAAETYGGCYDLLAENDIITPDLSRRLRRMAGFRNLLVHGYADIDNAQMLVTMRDNLQDLEEFLTAVFTLLDRGEQPQ